MCYFGGAHLFHIQDFLQKKAGFKVITETSELPYFKLVQEIDDAIQKNDMKKLMDIVRRTGLSIGKLVEMIPKSMQQCADISKFQQPFFSY